MMMVVMKGSVVVVVVDDGSVVRVVDVTDAVDHYRDHYHHSIDLIAFNKMPDHII